MNNPGWAKVAAMACFSSAVIVLLAGCNAGTIDASVGGTVVGLSGGTSVKLLNNNTDPITVSGNTNFNFDVQIPANGSYNVTVNTQPIGESCIVENGSGTVDQGGDDVTNIVVSCASTLATSSTNNILGSVSGLATGGSVTLLLNNSSSVIVNTNGSFVFPTPLTIGTAYSVTVGTNPTGQTCIVTNGSGTVPSGTTTNSVSVTCS